MGNTILKLALVALVPLALTVIFYLLEKHTPFGKLPYKARQIIIGIIFGAAAVFGTEFGVPIEGAQVNARDAAPLCAGLFFGGPAGIIAGVIGGVERWISVYWGIGAYTRIACSVSTILAGLYAAFLRKFMFDDKKPAPFMAFCIGVVMETVHMTMVFLTHMSDVDTCFGVIRTVTIPMVLVNAVCLWLTSILIYLLRNEKMTNQKVRNSITRRVQVRLLVAIVVCYLVTSTFTFLLQWNVSEHDTNDQLESSLVDVQNDIRTRSDESLLKITRRLGRELNMNSTDLVMNYHMMAQDVSEINLVDGNGIIVKSTNPDYIGFDMKLGEQSDEFNCLLNGEKEYVQAYQPISYDTSGGTSYKYAGVVINGGYIQVGYDAERFQEALREQVESIVLNRHLGDEGFMAVVDEKGHVIGGTEMTEEMIQALDITSEEVRNSNKDADYKRSIVTIGDVQYYKMHARVEGYYIYALIPLEQARWDCINGIYLNSFTEILIFALLFAVIYFIIKNLVVKNIRSVNKSLAVITGGDLDEKVDVRGTSEFAALSDDINSTVDTLKDYIAQAAARIDAELEFARNIQASSLPGIFPPFPNRKEVDLHAAMFTAKEVGGDFYDYYWIDQNRLAVLVADVSGKGIPAALFMMKAKTMLKNFAETGIAVNEAFVHANDELCDGNDAGMFVTAWMGVLDVTTGHMEFANAGHNPPVVKHGNGKFEYLKCKPGFILAGMEGMFYKKQELDLEPGSVLYLYTDGVTEATDTDNQLFGEDRLQAVLNANANTAMDTLCGTVKQAVDDFVGEAPQFDDITMVALRFVKRTGDLEAEPEETEDYVVWGMEPDEITRNAEIEAIPEITEWMDTRLEKLECPLKAQMQLDVALDELFSNIAKYAYGPYGGEATLRMESVEWPERAVVLTLSDSGKRFNPLLTEDPDVKKSAEDRVIGGLGIYMVRKTMDDMQYEYVDGHNVLKITKKL